MVTCAKPDPRITTFPRREPSYTPACTRDTQNLTSQTARYSRLLNPLGRASSPCHLLASPGYNHSKKSAEAAGPPAAMDSDYQTNGEGKKKKTFSSTADCDPACPPLPGTLPHSTSDRDRRTPTSRYRRHKSIDWNSRFRRNALERPIITRVHRRYKGEPRPAYTAA